MHRRRDLTLSVTRGFAYTKTAFLCVATLFFNIPINVYQFESSQGLD